MASEVLSRLTLTNPQLLASDHPESAHCHKSPLGMQDAESIHSRACSASWEGWGVVPERQESGDRKDLCGQGNTLNAAPLSVWPSQVTSGLELAALSSQKPSCPCWEELWWPPTGFQ